MSTSTGTELRVALALRGKTARAVARKAGISEFRFSRILNDRVATDADTLARVRAAIYDDSPQAA